VYADDITLLSGSCHDSQKMLDICAEFGHEWDISFNAKESKFNARSPQPDNCRLLSDSSGSVGSNI